MLISTLVTVYSDRVVWEVVERLFETFRNWFQNLSGLLEQIFLNLNFDNDP